MGGGFVTVGAHPGDFGFEQRDARGQLVLRERLEGLAGEQAGGITSAKGAGIVLHGWEASDGLRLLSTAGSTRASQETD